jgi:hypothetical protein
MHRLKLWLPYSSAGSDVLTNQMVRGATLELGSRKFRVNLIVMPGLVLDVIIGMNWMEEWGSSYRYRKSGTYPEGSPGRGYFSDTIVQKNRPCECDMCYGSHSDSLDSSRV